MNFSELLKAFLAVFEPYSEEFFLQKEKEGLKYSKLIRQFYLDLADFSRGGKKLRSFLVYLGYSSGKGSIKTIEKKILPVCLSYELLHDFLLIHDDIIDRSKERRQFIKDTRSFSGSITG